MALAVDRFEFLAREIISLLTSTRDALAVVGTAVAIRKSLSVVYRLVSTFNTYALSQLTRPNFTERYGEWAVVTGTTHGIGKAFVQELASRGMNVVIISLGASDCQHLSMFLVITGSTDGIGAAYCSELAARGMNVILVSRSAHKLTNFAHDLEESFNVRTEIIAVDFNEGQGAFDKIQPRLKDKQIGVLVNNVGVMYDFPQYFLDVPYEKLWQLVNVNIAAATMMTHLVLPQMVQRGRGAVITVSSGACFLPTPQMLVYAATKQYLKCFMKGLEYEYRSSGVTFQCLLPFYVATRMTRYSSTLSNPSLFIPTATTYARHALATLGWARETPGYWPHSLQLWFAGLLPEWLYLWGASRLNNALRRQAQYRIRHRSGVTLASPPGVDSTPVSAAVLGSDATPGLGTTAPTVDRAADMTCGRISVDLLS